MFWEVTFLNALKFHQREEDKKEERKSISFNDVPAVLVLRALFAGSHVSTPSEINFIGLKCQ